MVKLYTPTSQTVAKKASELINWAEVLSKVSISIRFLNKCRNYNLSREDIEDAAQDACLKIFSSIDSYDASKSRFETWAFTIAANCCRDLLRSTKTKSKHLEFKSDEELDSTDNTVDNEAFRKDFESLLELVLEPLKESYREAIRCLIDGADDEEMVRRIRCSKKNLRPTICRARREVRKPLTRMGIL